MPNETQIECYFKSSELAELCRKGKDIIINFKASYPPDAPPKFEITANVFTRGKKTGKSVKSAPLGDGTPGGTGCPKPC